MRTAPSFRLQLAALAIGSATLLGCASGERDSTGDRTDDVLSTIVKQPNSIVCADPTATHRCKARVRVDSTNRIKNFATPSGFGPSDLASAYKLDTTKGAGMTIAVVDAYNYTAAETDLATYRTQFGLPACTVANGCFKVVNQTGATSPLPKASPSNDDWTVEAALDLDMASAACPNCKIVLVEADDDKGSGLDLAQNGAASLGVNVISNSWGEPEPSTTPTADEVNFNHPGIGEFVAAGDNGYNDGGQGPDYPSTSAYTTAVGGTSLVKASNTRGWTEGAWSTDGNASDGAGGSSCSVNIPKPSWQTDSACTKRATADVSAVGDPNTGVAVFNSANGGWIVVGGTSASSPFVAGVYALTGHPAVGPSFAYGNAGDFFDVTTGTNGTCGTVLCNAGAGWDGPTGIGTPNGVALGGGTTCTPACSGKTCGDDGCGGSCGTCASGDSCTAAGQCQAPGCTPACTGKTCGDDGCGGSCGSCTGGATCGSAGTCSGGTTTCAHPICSAGTDLDASCDACATKICAQDDYCCTNAWDTVCVGEVASICGESCTTAGSCAHTECSAGTKLTTGCDSCVTSVCASDSYCCTTKWDSQCVSEVSSICSESCN